MLKGGCTECSGTPVARHSSSWATEKLETPIARILPAFNNASHAAAVSAIGCGAGQCSW